MTIESLPCAIEISFTANGIMTLRLSGKWIIEGKLPTIEPVVSAFENRAEINRIEVSGNKIEDWDSRLIVFLLQLKEYFAAHSLSLNWIEMPEGVLDFIRLATAVPEKSNVRKEKHHISFLVKVGNESLEIVQDTINFFSFVGEAVISLGRLITGNARFRTQDLWLILQQCGPHALPIVSMISFLIGLILAFVGVMQLKLFGAQIYIANLVGLGMSREMGAMMTAIIMAGRTGSAFAAQLGSMQVNEEIDALKTMGIHPFDFLVLPRMIALIMMMPMLCLYADLMGIVGGFFVGVGLMDLSFIEYYEQTKNALSLTDFSVGLIKSSVFGVLVALTGCLHGMHCGRSSSAVGLATTSAVVYGIVSIVVADSMLTIIYDQLGI